MKIRTICVGRPQALGYQNAELLSSIIKQPVSGPVFVDFENIDGDEQADPRVHGGPEKAVYAYSAEAYQWWQQAPPPKGFSRAFRDGDFGENLTITDCDDAQVFVGDTFKVGTCTLQVTQPRVPCVKLAAKFNDPQMIKRFFESRRPGIYFRVLTPGLIQADDSLELISREKTPVSLLELFDFVQGKPLEKSRAREIVAVSSLAEVFRYRIQQRVLGEG